MQDSRRLHPDVGTQLENLLKKVEISGFEVGGSADGFDVGFRKALEYSRDGGLVAPMYLLIKRYPPYIEFAANSEEDVGYGKFRGKKDHYVVTVHGGIDGGGIVTPEVINKGRRPCAPGAVVEFNGVYLDEVFLKRDVLGDLLQGILPDGSRIDLFSYEQVLAGEHYNHIRDLKRFGIVRTLDLAKKTKPGYQTIDNNLLILDGEEVKHIDSQVVVYAAGVQEGVDLLNNKVQYPYPGNPTLRGNDSFPVWHAFNSPEFRLDKPQGRILFLDSNINSYFWGEGGLIGCGWMHYRLRGHFVGISAEAVQAYKQAVSHIKE